jgi:hypothetical protein
MVEFEPFARGVDPRIRTTCSRCPPETPPGNYSVWEFTLGTL